MDWKRKFSLNTIRKKMLFSFLLAMVMMGFVSAYMSINSSNFLQKIDSMFYSSIIYQDVKLHLEQAEKNLALYIQTKDSDYLNDYILHSEMLEQSGQTLEKELGARNPFKINKINNLIETFTESSNRAVYARRGRDINTSRENYVEAHSTARYIMEEIEKLNLEQLETNTQYYLALSRNMAKVQKVNGIMIVDSIVLGAIIILYITYKMTDPIIKLSHSAEEISKGNFETQEVMVSSKDEIKVMAEAFNKMKESIRNYIKALRSKAETEAKLMEKEMQNLKMQTLLNDAQLQALQSQINPHFLFNTLNAGVQLSMLEGADKTTYFLENIAAVFRYNVRGLDQKVTLKDEINSVRAYLDLMKVRFGEDIKVIEKIEDSEMLDMHMPPLILQPIVENSCIHGIGEKETGGTISISIRQTAGYGIIKIEDDGVGMDEETIHDIFEEASKQEVPFTKPKKGHTTGIGINNVIQRLRLFYKTDDVISFDSTKGKGTKVVIKIPLKLEEQSNVQINHSG